MIQSWARQVVGRAVYYVFGTLNYGGLTNEGKACWHVVFADFMLFLKCCRVDCKQSARLRIVSAWPLFPEQYCEVWREHKIAPQYVLVLGDRTGFSLLWVQKHSESILIIARFFFLSLTGCTVSPTFSITHCHTILPTNWLLGNMALWMGCIFISVCSGLETLRGEKHPYCSLVSSVCTVATKALVDMSLKFSSRCIHFIRYAWYSTPRRIYTPEVYNCSFVFRFLKLSNCSTVETYIIEHIRNCITVLNAVTLVLAGGLHFSLGFQHICWPWHYLRMWSIELSAATLLG